MHQSFVSKDPMGPWKSGAFNFSIFEALLKATPPDAGNDEEQQLRVCDEKVYGRGLNFCMYFAN